MQEGETALYWAACCGCVDIVQVLIDYGAAVDLGRDKVVTIMLELNIFIMHDIEKHTKILILLLLKYHLH